MTSKDPHFYIPDEWQAESATPMPAVREAVKALIESRAAHLDIWISALLSIDPDAPEKYELVEMRDPAGFKTKWYFQKRAE